MWVNTQNNDLERFNCADPKWNFETINLCIHFLHGD